MHQYVNIKQILIVFAKLATAAAVRHWSINHKIIVDCHHQQFYNRGQLNNTLSLEYVG